MFASAVQSYEIYISSIGLGASVGEEALLCCRFRWVLVVDDSFSSGLAVTFGRV
jgi:hypothetical protein